MLRSFEDNAADVLKDSEETYWILEERSRETITGNGIKQELRRP